MNSAKLLENMDNIKKSIDKKIEFNSSKNIFADKEGLFVFIKETTDAISCINQLDKDAENILIDYTLAKSLKEFCRVNQYYSFNTQSKNELREIYVDLFKKIRKGEIPIAEISENHYQQLQYWLIKCNPFAEKIYAGNNYQLEAIACSEYSPELQIAVLGIDLKHIKQPVLDIGCGTQGNLVNFLNNQNIEAYGIDRFTIAESMLTNSDWLEFDYGIEKWGCIISNLGFSNHFIHHNLRNDGNYINYAKTYMAILQSLKKGGSFYYAPELAFIEIYLDKRAYHIENRMISGNDFKASIITKLN